MGNSNEIAVHPSNPFSSSVSLHRRLSFTHNKKLGSEKTILLLGLDNSGKSTFAYGLASISNVPCTNASPPSWSPPYPAPSKNVTTKSAAIQARMFRLLDMPGHRDSRHLWYENLGELGAICFCIDISDTLRFPLVAKELERLHHEHQKLEIPPVVWILFTKADCLYDGPKLTAIDAYESIKKNHTFLTRNQCEWAFILMPMINCLSEPHLAATKTWINDNLAQKP
ncbi:hypothetical protein THRCLA_10615 [Thraustotheca clavata]|uniref:ADP-ribosylation factor family n=1 Tax=Thraustotheca clavata TaxID=74557 RepID=A0A1V9YJI6_9STRA|nr:hypothetical protein THRCLA_10615 [Thraustotheca clavata]